eukprot:c15857_g1_i1 orf=395-1069(-)
MASSSNSPCAACKFLRRKCTTECVFAPYFPPDQPQKFANVHKIFGASNVTKLLNELTEQQREDAVNSLAYEAEARVRDPVYGCVGTISLLQQQVNRLQREIAFARQELCRYMGETMDPVPQQLGPSSSLCIGMGVPKSSSPDQQLLAKEQIMQFSRQETHFTREQIMELARLHGGGAYESGFTTIGLTGPLRPIVAFPPARTSDGGNGNTTRSGGRLSPSQSPI